MPKENGNTKEEKNLVLVVENANTKLKKIVNDAFLNAWNKPYTKSQVEILIQETELELKEMEADEDFIKDTIKGIKQTFLREYREVIAILTKSKKKDNTGLIAYTLSKMKATIPFEVQSSGGIMVNLFDDKAVIGQANVENIRQYMTEYELGAAGRYVDYTTRLEEAMTEITDKVGSGAITLKDKNGRRLSLRNMAEISVRYQLIVDDCKNMPQGTLVCATSHSNSSDRCKWWQGKIFLLDLNVATREMGQYKGGKPPQDILGYVDGKPYYSLKQACENGFLSYNCQHRLVKYYKGIQPPRYDMVTVKQKNDATSRQRALESRIRDYKAREELSVKGVKVLRTDPFTGKKREMEERRYNELMSKYWQEQYKTFSKDNNLPIYEWRTRITETERELRKL